MTDTIGPQLARAAAGTDPRGWLGILFSAKGFADSPEDSTLPPLGLPPPSAPAGRHHRPNGRSRAPRLRTPRRPDHPR